MSSMQEFKDGFARHLYGMTSAEAIEKGICIHCKELAVPRCYSGDGLLEYKISGLCEPCFDEITKEPDDE